MPETQSAPAVVEGQRQGDELECITQDPREPAGPEFLEVCDNKPQHLICSRFCPPECGGHLVCHPCFELGISRGLIKEVGAPRDVGVRDDTSEEDQ